jgi:hypothetical protein
MLESVGHEHRELTASTDVATALCDACGDRCFLKHLVPADDVGDYVERSVEAWQFRPVCRACYDAHVTGGVPALAARMRALDEARRRRQYAPVIGTART